MTGHVRISVAAWIATVLGSMVLVPVFSGPFLFISAFLCAIVTGTGVLLQNWRAPRLLVPIAQLVVLVEAIALMFVRPTLRFGVVPWKETALEFNQQMVNALDAINRFSAPLPPESHLTVFAVSVIGAVGLLIHLIAVQFRQAAWSGLLLLTTYTVPAATVHGGLPALLFIPPAIGYIVLLSAEGRTRLSHWGRRISGVAQFEGSEPIEASALGQAGRRIGLTVIAVAALLPALLPALPEGVLGNGLSGGGAVGGGLGTSVQLSNPILDMGRNLRRGDNVTALTYSGPGPVYLRFTALDSFDGDRWQASSRVAGKEVDGDFTPPPGYTKDVSALPQNRYQVHVSKWLRSSWVPVPYPTHKLSINGKWRYDSTTMDVMSTSGRTVAGLKYTVTAYDVRPSEQDLRDSIPAGPPDQTTSEVPRRTPTEIRQLARTITTEANGNRYEQAALLQDYFRDEDRFSYALTNEKGSGMRALEEFLFEDRTGYCEQFATAMALMARTLGIPARVAIGFLPGQSGEDGKYTVRMHDMHAWPELYFQGVGWVRFEPTPSQRTGQPPDWTVPNPDGAPGDDPSTGPSESPGPQGSDDPNDPRDPLDPERNLPQDDPSAIGGTGGWWNNGGTRWATGGAGALVLLGVPWLVRTLVRRRRFGRAPGRESVEAIWSEIRDTARDVGLPWSDTATPRRLGDGLRERLPKAVHPDVVRLVRAVEAVRYAGRDGTGLNLRADATAVRRALWSGATRKRRWRALLLPPSWRWYLNRGSAEASDLLDQFDLGLARLRATLPPGRSQG